MWLLLLHAHAVTACCVDKFINKALIWQRNKNNNNSEVQVWIRKFEIKSSSKKQFKTHFIRKQTAPSSIWGYFPKLFYFSFPCNFLSVAMPGFGCWKNCLNFQDDIMIFVCLCFFLPSSSIHLYHLCRHCHFGVTYNVKEMTSLSLFDILIMMYADTE